MQAGLGPWKASYINAVDSVTSCCIALVCCSVLGMGAAPLTEADIPLRFDRYGYLAAIPLVLAFVGLARTV